MSIDGKTYPFEDFDSVVDPNYILAQMKKDEAQNTDKTENEQNNEENNEEIGGDSEE